MAYRFIEPRHLHGDCENVHIFKENSDGIINNESVCGKVHYKDAIGIMKFTGSEARSHASVLQNGIYKVCGHCVATLYSQESLTESLAGWR